MFIPDKTKKTVRILVRIKNGQVVRFDSTPLPKIADGTLGDLILPARSISDDGERQELEAESTAELLPAETCVFVGLSLDMIKGIPPGLKKPEDLKIGHGYLFVEVRLQEPLKLHFRGDKEPCLKACKCFIPVLNAEAVSLNHAFTLLSTRYETGRISHSGNVFTRVFFKGKERWHSLNEARGKIELTAY